MEDGVDMRQGGEVWWGIVQADGAISFQNWGVKGESNSWLSEEGC